MATNVEENRDTLMKRLRIAALSGGASGGILGSLHSAMSPKSTLGSIGLGALKTAGLGAVAAPSGLLAGEAILGAPEKGEVNPYTHRGLAGGAAVGAAGGGLAALYLASGGKIPLSKLGSFGSFLDEGAQGALQKNNIIMNKLRSWAANPSAKNMLKASVMGTSLGGLAGGGFAMGEGQEADIISNEAAALHKKRIAKRSQDGY